MNFSRFQVSRFLLMTSLMMTSCLSMAEVIFEENFDSQPDFTSTMHTVQQSQHAERGDILPVGWDSLYQGTLWSPETGFPNNHASLEILASNAQKARGSVGKSMVNWRESYDAGWNNWASDSQLQKLLDQEYDEIYVEFWISFSSNWAARTVEQGGLSKIFRVGSYDGVGDPFNGAAGALGPVFFWDYNKNSYGMRNTQTFRGGPWGENYHFDFGKAGVVSESNFGSQTAGMAVGGGNPQVVDLVNGGYLVDIDRYSWITHNQLFGPPGHWTKVAFYVKMNSAPGVADGVMMQWINNQRIKVETAVPWVGANEKNMMVGWNFISIGGNDFFRPYPNEVRFEDWYSIDDVVVRTSVPEELLAENPPAPNPPVDIGIQ
ncbi:hypothetical protein KUV35_03315 [Marinobacter salsuginis]|uniref:hypothetical protein n=1 Tax=Marinobacter salsuginis TaxID=418719 RepID=UPI001C94D125|nr:hypothetical protein [Marinobacter salsuginis]MBY6070310.1 hypothetical protein [Marinobacter salsuginis]